MAFNANTALECIRDIKLLSRGSSISQKILAAKKRELVGLLSSEEFRSYKEDTERVYRKAPPEVLASLEKLEITPERVTKNLGILVSYPSSPSTDNLTLMTLENALIIAEYHKGRIEAYEEVAS